MYRIFASTLVLLMLYPAFGFSREPRKEQRTWAELGARIEGRKVSLVLPTGMNVRGNVLRVEPDGLRLTNVKASETVSLTNGELVIPRQSLGMIRLTNRTVRWRLICTIAAPIIVTAAIAGAYGDLPEKGAQGGGAIAGGILGSIPIGYLGGWWLDGRATEITVVTDPR
jgi:hypothetical protein